MILVFIRVDLVLVWGLFGLGLGFFLKGWFRVNVGFCQDISYFSLMRSKGSRFTLGVWVLRVCSLDVAFTVATVRNRSQPFATVRNRSQPFATVRNRSQPFASVRNRPQPFARLLYGRAYSKFCRGCHFWRFPTSRCFISRGRRGTS